MVISSLSLSDGMATTSFHLKKNSDGVAASPFYLIGKRNVDGAATSPFSLKGNGYGMAAFPFYLKGHSHGPRSPDSLEYKVHILHVLHKLYILCNISIIYSIWDDHLYILSEVDGE